MGEIVNVVVAFAVIVFLFRWVTSSSDSPEAQRIASALGFKPKNVTQEQVETVHSMFPDIPIDNIRFDLLRSGNVEHTTNKILERGFLDAPPAGYYTVYTRPPQQSSAAPVARPVATATATAKQQAKQNLIARYKLQDRIAAVDAEPISDEQVGGKAVWEDSAEKREKSLQERKAQMIIAARQRFLAQQAKAAADTPSNGL
ncbi:hypothetical protein PLICRDRAFT_44596 [Plicaturopsis crispa FD-325 SS-3]|nr:hypothetical protein PLICRDRAFT_44596 [Plicaturopsis crispa FD-325 SS-3]